MKKEYDLKEGAIAPEAYELMEFIRDFSKKTNKFEYGDDIVFTNPWFDNNANLLVPVGEKGEIQSGPRKTDGFYLIKLMPLRGGLRLFVSPNSITIDK
jgi:hypothetical protein